jgi:hypothetical protein
MLNRFIRAAALALSWCLCATAGIAQTSAPAPAPTSEPMSTPTPTPGPGSEKAPKRPARGNGALFGATDSQSKARPLALDLTLAVSSAYDDDLSEGQSVSSLQAPVGGEFADLTAGLLLSRKAHHSRVGARATTSLRHYGSLHRLLGSSYSAGTDVAFDVTRKLGIQASVDGAYVSEFAFDTISRQSGLGNVALSSTGLDIAALDGARLSYGGAVGLTRKVGMRSAFTLTAVARDSERRIIHEFAAERTVGASLARSLGRDTSIQFGYNVRSSSQRLEVATRPAWTHDAQFGVERRWRHPGERRTVVSLSAGPSFLQPGPTGISHASSVSSTATQAASRVLVGGSAAVNHDMSRSWNLGASYRRGAGSIDGLVSNSGAVDLRGLLSRRVELSASAGYFQADLGLAGVQSRYTTRYGSSRLQVAVTRGLALYGQYLFYDYDYGSGTTLAGGFAPQQQRRGARAGLTLWLPLHGAR